MECHRTRKIHFSFHVLKIYDGPYSSSPLLLAHREITKPNSIRSSTNQLYIEFPSYFHDNYQVEIHYTSVWILLSTHGLLKITILSIVRFRWRRMENRSFQVSSFYNNPRPLIFPPFVKNYSITGCGGYIYEDGVISSFDYPASDEIIRLTKCTWLIETRNEDKILLKSLSNGTESEDTIPLMTV